MKRSIKIILAGVLIFLLAYAIQMSLIYRQLSNGTTVERTVYRKR